MDTKPIVMFFACITVWIKLAVSQNQVRKRTYRVVSILSPPFLMKNTKQGSKDKYEGYIADLADEISLVTQLNFSIYLAPDGLFGIKKRTRFWSGMIGELKTRRADVAMSPMTITHRRSAVVDFTTPFMKSGTTLVARRNMRLPVDKKGPGISYPFSPFHSLVWFIILVSFVLTSFLAAVLEQVSQGDGLYLHRSIGYGFWWSTLALTFQGFVRSPKSAGVIVLVTFWTLVSIINVVLYVSGMTTFMTMEPIYSKIQNAPHVTHVRQANPIKTVRELGQQTKVKYGCIEKGSTYAFYMNSEDDVYRNMWTHMENEEPKPYFRNMKEGIDKVNAGEGNFIFLAESKLSSFYAGRKPCNLDLIGDDFNVVEYGIATPRNSALRELMAEAVETLKQRGTLDNLEKKWFKDDCKDDNDTLMVDGKLNIVAGKVLLFSGKALQVSSYYGVILLMCVGMVLSVIVSLVECDRRRKRKKSEDLDLIGL